MTNQDHDHDIHAAASNSGQQTRAEDQSENKVQKDSAATSQKDVAGTAKKAAEEKGRKDWGLGLQDERGGVSRMNTGELSLGRLFEIHSRLTEMQKGH